MSVLHEILSSRVRSEIFRLLFGASERQLYVREMERRTGLSVATVRQELQKLLRMQLVEAQRSGNRLYYRANKGHPLYPDIRNMVLKTAGMVDVLMDATRKWDYTPVALPKQQYMEWAREIRNELGFPSLQPKEPWFGRSLGMWPEQYVRQAELAERGDFDQVAEGLTSRGNKI